MKILLLAFVGCCLILVIIFGIIWLCTDWKKLERNNKQFLNEDGLHIYYDQSLIRQREEKARKERNAQNNKS